MELKKVVSLLMLVLSVLFFALSVGGVITILVYRQPLSNASLNQLQTTREDLMLVGEDIETIRGQLESALAQINIFQSVLEAVGLDAVENAQIVSDVVTKVEGTITPMLDSVGGGAEKIRETFISVKETIEKLNEIPFVSMEVPGAEIIDGLIQSVENLQTQVDDTKDKVENVSQITQDTVETLRTGFTNWEETIVEYIESLDEYDLTINEYQEQLTYLEENVPRWINIASIALTVLLVWTAFSQVALFVLSWSFYKERDILARWR
ncbi:MAG: hypothetical protein U9R58_01490 [Chloroflexota bacterium]|nr:hypothetical protein [Chloroflexota bacterium]